MVVNATFINNRAPSGSVVWNGRESHVEFWNSIMWNNEAGDGESMRNDDDNTMPLGYSIIEGGLPSGFEDAGGNKVSDPLFVDPDGPDGIPATVDDNLRVLSGSPAIDTGSNSSLPVDFFDLDQDGDTSEYLPVDIDLNMRIFDGGTGTEDPTVDIGAYEYGAPPIVLANDRISDERPRSKNLISNYPNPFSVSTTISYSVSAPSEVTFEIYDILGKRVRVLEQGYRAAGEHEVQLEAAGLSAGVYFVRLSAGSNSQTRKMVVVR